MLVTDRLTIHDKKRTSDGYLVTEARFARTGLYQYSGRDLGKPDMDTVVVFRPEDEVFNEAAMASFAHKPVTNDHPGDNVTAQTWKRDAVGFTDGRVARDGDFISIPMMIADQSAIEAVDAGKRELSAGYACDVEFIDGTAPDGSHYDAIMRNIRGNHIAIVDRGRAGSECRIGDRFVQDDKEPKPMQLQQIVIDGITIEATQQSAQAISKLQDTIAGLRTSASEATTVHATAIADKDKELAAKDAKIAELEGKVLDAKALDTLVADRAKLVGIAARLVDKFDATGKDTATIKREVVKAKCGDTAVADKSDAYIDARFDTLAEALAATGGPDQFRDALLGGAGGSGPVAGTSMSVEDARAEEAKARDEANDLNRWRNKSEVKAA